MFFGLYLEDILKECRKAEFAYGDNLVLIPEFPLQKNEVNNECTNLDYLVFNVSKQNLYSIKLKTDNHSVDDTQIEYYRKFTLVEPETLFEFVNKKRPGRSGKKYKALAEYIRKERLDKCNWSKGNVIYILPKKSKKVIEAGFDYITFAEISERMKPHASDDELLSEFLKFIANINEY